MVYLQIINYIHMSSPVILYIYIYVIFSRVAFQSSGWHWKRYLTGCILLKVMCKFTIFGIFIQCNAIQYNAM